MSNHLKSLAKIIIIENNEELLSMEKLYLETNGYEVFGYTTTQGVEAVINDMDLMILERKLPSIDGCDFVTYIRGKGLGIPVIFASDKITDREIEEGFSCGGDDYLRKPFNVRELHLRIKALLKRSSHIEENRVSFRDITLDHNERKAYIDNGEVKITKLEFNLLSFLIKHKHKILERDYLLHHIWGDESDKQKRTVNVAINRLKKKIDPDGNKSYIVPVAGIGYKLV